MSINSFHRSPPQMPARPAEVPTSDLVLQDGATVILGGFNDPAFKEAAPEGGYLIGFEVSTEPFSQSSIVATVRPIFRTSNGEVLGKQYGNRRKEVISVKSKEGYAVGAITVKSGLLIDGFSMTFVRIKNGKVIAGDSYESEWLGGTGGGKETRLGIGNATAIGIIGKSNDNQCTGLGLLFPPNSSK